MVEIFLSHRVLPVKITTSVLASPDLVLLTLEYNYSKVMSMGLGHPGKQSIELTDGDWVRSLVGYMRVVALRFSVSISYLLSFFTLSALISLSQRHLLKELCMYWLSLIHTNSISLCPRVPPAYFVLTTASHPTLFLLTSFPHLIPSLPSIQLLTVT